MKLWFMHHLYSHVEMLVHFVSAIVEEKGGQNYFQQQQHDCY